MIELVAPFLLFMPRRIRQMGAKFLIALQVCIALTGNYAYFNLLTLALLMWAFDDQSFEGIAARLKWLRPRSTVVVLDPIHSRYAWLSTGVLAVVSFLGAAPSAGSVCTRLRGPAHFTFIVGRAISGREFLRAVCRDDDNTPGDRVRGFER